MGMRFGQGGSPLTRVAAASNVFTGGDASAVALTFVGRYFFTSVAAADQMLCAIDKTGPENAIRLYFTGSALQLAHDFSLTNSLPYAAAALSTSTWYDIVAVYPADRASATFYIRATSAGSTGFSAVGVAATMAFPPAGTRDTATLPPAFGRDHASAAQFTGDARDLAVFEGELSAADIERFGQGCAPFQLTSATLRASPAEMWLSGNSTTGCYDRVDGLAMTVSGTWTGLGVTGFDGPLWDEETGAPSLFATGKRSRYTARSVIKDANNRVAEMPDMSGLGAHMCQPTIAEKPWYASDFNGRPAVVLDPYLATVRLGGLVSLVGDGVTATGTMPYPHGLTVGHGITISGCTGASAGFGSSGTPVNYTVATVPSPTTFTVASGVNATATGVPAVHYTTASAKYLRALVGAGGSWPNTNASTNAFSFAIIGSFSSAGHTASSTVTNVIRLADSGAANQLIVQSYAGTGGGASNAESLIIAVGSNLSSSISAKQIVASNVCSFAGSFAGNAGSTASGYISRVDGVAATFTQTGGLFTRYPYMIGSNSTTGPTCIIVIHEIRLWQAAMTAADLTTAEDYLRDQWDIVPTANIDAVLCVFGSSTGEGQGSAGGMAGSSLIEPTGAVRIVNLAEGGVKSYSALLTGVSGVTGTFQRGESVRHTVTLETATFLAYTGTEISLIDHTGTTWTAAGSILGLTSGATANFTARQLTGGARSVFMASRQATAAAIWAQYPTAQPLALINSASNGMGAGAVPTGSSAAIEFASLTSFDDTLKVTTPTVITMAQPHQPRTGGTVANHIAYRDALRTAVLGTDFDVLVDTSTLTAFDNYTTDFDDITYYLVDDIHLNNNGHAAMADYIADYVAEYVEGADDAPGGFLVGVLLGTP